MLEKEGPRRISPILAPTMTSDAAGVQIALMFGLKGPNFSVSSACSSGSDAIGQAYMMISHDEADMMLAGGTEAPLGPIAIAAFAAARALSTRNNNPRGASRPFDAGRDGFVMGEGAGMLVLESLDHALSRGANILAELAAYKATNDAFHLTQPSPEGEGAIRAIRGALELAGVEPDEIGYVNAHGTSTLLNDRVETLAIKSVLGPHAHRIPISATKSMTGHLLGATGAIEAAVCVLAINQGIVPPTINLEQPDPECDLDYVPHRARRVKVDAAISNAFAFAPELLPLDPSRRLIRAQKQDVHGSVHVLGPGLEAHGVDSGPDGVYGEVNGVLDGHGVPDDGRLGLGLRRLHQ